MKLEINFLKNRLTLAKKKAQKQFLFKIWSLIGLVVYSLGVAALFFTHLLAKKQNEILTAKIENEQMLIKNQQTIEAKQLYLTAKTKSLKQILAEKEQHQNLIESFLALLPSDISIEKLDVNSDGSVSFSASCPSLRAMTDFFSILSSNENNSILKIKETKIKDVNYGHEKEYAFEAVLYFYSK